MPSNLPRAPGFYLSRSAYDYPLPEELIAQQPAARRDASRLLVCDAQKNLSDHCFSDLPRFLRAGDVLVINESRVLPARLFAPSAAHPGRKVELLLLHRTEKADCWECLVRPGKHALVGDRFAWDDRLSCEVVSVTAQGNRVMRFTYGHDTPFLTLLSEFGEMPLPPYIKAPCQDPERYQTVYARVPGSAAAPTAGFHFTEPMMHSLRGMGVLFCPVVLHIGLGTFRPVKEENILRHHMHTERYAITQTSADMINAAKREGRRVVAVGTTSCRTLEAAADPDTGFVRAGEADTALFIYPGYRFRTVDALITNFHLPQSTLLMLVCAFYGYDDTLRAYHHAIEKEYRFFSFGDACLFL